MFKWYGIIQFNFILSLKCFLQNNYYKLKSNKSTSQFVESMMQELKIANNASEKKKKTCHLATKQTTFIYMQTKPKRSHSENLKTRPQNKDNVQEEIGNTTGKTQQKPGHQKWRVGMQSNKLKKTESNLKARKENQKKKKKDIKTTS